MDGVFRNCARVRRIASESALTHIGCGTEIFRRNLVLARDALSASAIWACPPGDAWAKGLGPLIVGQVKTIQKHESEKVPLQRNRTKSLLPRHTQLIFVTACSSH